MTSAELFNLNYRFIEAEGHNDFDFDSRLLQVYCANLFSDRSPSRPAKRRPQQQQPHGTQDDFFRDM